MEVGPRDGLQNEDFVDTENKISFISDLSLTGLSRIEVTAFVNPKWVPSLADQIEVVRGIKKISGVKYSALVPNIKGYELASKSGIDEIALVISASNSHNKKNINKTTEQALLQYKQIATKAQADNIPFRVYISCAFGCPYEGNISIKSVSEIAKKFIDLGAYQVSISDTIGVGNPIQTFNIIKELTKIIFIDKLALHMHDTRGLALSNILVALDLGVSSFDSAIGGLGGCPYAPGASGNVSTEDLVYMLHSIGIQTGIDLDNLCNVSKKLQKLLGHKFPSKVLSCY